MSIIEAFIVNEKSHSEGAATGRWHEFPTSKEELLQTFSEIGVKSHTEVFLSHYETTIPCLSGHLSIHENLDEVNYLAAKLSGMEADDLMKFEAVVLANRHCGSLAEIINIAENPNCLDLQPAFSAKQYGAFHVNLARDEHADMMNRLESSVNPAERDFFTYIAGIETHINLAAYGKFIAENEGGVFTEQGYLTEASGFQEIYKGPEDIPAEYRVLAEPEPVLSVKVENADLTDLLLKMHALGGDYMHDAQYNMNVLENRRSPEHLLLMIDRSMFLTEAMHVYRHDTDSYKLFVNAADSPDTRAFALHVTDVHQPHVFGDLVEVSLSALREDILQNCIYPTRIDAVPKFGPDQSFTPEQWNAMEAIDRSMLRSWNRHFESEDLSSVIRHLDEICGEHANISNTVTSDTFLSDFNLAYMEKAENPQPGMLRVTLTAAKEMLTHGDLPVYRLMLEGAKELSPLDAMQSRGGLWFSNYREFAISKNDSAGLDKWSERQADTLTNRTHEKNAPNKSKKNNEPEL